MLCAFYWLKAFESAKRSPFRFYDHETDFLHYAHIEATMATKQLMSHLAKSTPRVTATKQMGLRLFTPWLQQFDALRKKDLSASSFSSLSMSCMEEEHKAMENSSIKDSPSRLICSTHLGYNNDKLRIYTPWLQEFDIKRKMLTSP
eukprot:gnl/TRDRNA2_/TRDRNA2_174630_c0_seq3.p1 gnl/TRDRNA2_/TRDRNA2_174630_c0~~gnl/TRDRNA2_/TRDRNA2_174630_c0_seq3.p1  ORF type:complete len:146 (+),score=31.88 gnl/TRDRNA2_/TRDRNA2_174630_c0_seq3:23-460(+)